jgi:hypothetical protein
MTRPIAVLPTPEQITDAPELVALHALAHGLELTFRTLVGAHPDLDDPDVPYGPSIHRDSGKRLTTS